MKIYNVRVTSVRGPVADIAETERLEAGMGMKRPRPQLRRAGRPAALALVAALALAGCQTFHDRPLDTAAASVASPDRLKADNASLRLAPLKPIAVDARDGLDPLEIAVLAVLNSPDLEAKRAAAKVFEAQVFSAGLLPDPQIALSVDLPKKGPDLVTAYSIAPSIDVQQLLTRSANKRSAKASAKQADLDLLWQEWGTAQQARQLAETVLYNERKAAIFARVAQRAGERYGQSQRGLARGDVASTTTGADLAVKLDAEAQLATAQHDAAKARLDLNALLGLKPEVVLPLVDSPDLPAWDAAALDAAATDLPSRRPDLLALQAGYKAQDDKLRAALLAQFPLLNVGFSHARDTSAIVTNGLSASFALPIFNRGRGQIAIEKATREQLHAEYQARLSQTEAETAVARTELRLALAQVVRLEKDVPVLEAMAARADGAYQRGDIDGQTYLTLQLGALNRRAELEDRKLAARNAEAVLETALFLPPAPNLASRPGAQP